MDIEQESRGICNPVQKLRSKIPLRNIKDQRNSSISCKLEMPDGSKSECALGLQSEYD